MPSEKKEEQLKEEAKSILEKFAKALDKVEEVPDSFVEREEDRREEKQNNKKEEKSDSEFRKIFFKNAPSVKEDCLQAEKGKWK